MTPEENLRDELLKQDGLREQKADNLRDQVLAKDEARVAMMRRLVILAWALVVAFPVAAVMIRLLFFRDATEPGPQLEPLFIVVWQGFLLIAVIFTISLYIRSRTLTMHQIQSSLALIEEHLKKMSQKE
jgi:hypothetical protein